jgi:hypothetical protein
MTGTFVRIVLALPIALAVVAQPAPSSAQGAAKADRKALAPMLRDIAAQGAEAYRRKDYAAALTAFRRVDALLGPDPAFAVETANARFNIALCLDALAKPADALVAYRAIDLAHVPEEHASRARQRIEALHQQGQLARLQVRCVAQGEARVALAELPKSVRPCGDTWTDLSPGTYHVRARSSAGEIAEREVVLAAGESREIELVWVARAAVDVPAATGPDATTLGFGWGGVGALAVGGGLLWGAHVAADSGADALARQRRATTQAAWADAVGDTRAAYERAETLQTASGVVAVVGAACAGYALWRLLD